MGLQLIGVEVQLEGGPKKRLYGVELLSPKTRHFLSSSMLNFGNGIAKCKWP